MSVPLNGGDIGDTSVTGTLSICVGTPGEGYIIYTGTGIVSAKEATTGEIAAALDVSRRVKGRVDALIEDLVPDVLPSGSE